MKNQFSSKKTGIVLMILFFFFAGFAQTPDKLQKSHSSELNNIWYEWPHEGNDGKTVFKTQKYIPVPGIDRQEEPYLKLLINTNGTFIVTQYCGYCPNYSVTEKQGIYNVVSEKDGITGLKISFATGEKNIPCDVISCTANKLIMSLPPSIKIK